MKLQMLNLRKLVNHFGEFAGFEHWWISSYLHTREDFHVMVYMAGKVRRFFLVHFNQSYIQRQLLRREGDCRQCSVCCNLLFTCPMLTKKGLCLIYSLCRPGACRVFPIDQRDIDEVKLCGGKCGYAFPKRDRSKS